MPPFENPTDDELEATLEKAEGEMEIGDDIEVRLGADADSPDSPISSEEE